MVNSFFFWLKLIKILQPLHRQMPLVLAGYFFQLLWAKVHLFCPQWQFEALCNIKKKLVLVIMHRGFLEHWNSQKSVCNIWQCFSCLLDEGIPKIWKKLNSLGGFLRADQGRAKMCCQMGWIGCAILQVAQKAIVRIQFLSYFWNPLIKSTWKMLLNACKTFLAISML